MNTRRIVERTKGPTDGKGLKRISRNKEGIIWNRYQGINEEKGEEKREKKKVKKKGKKTKKWKRGSTYEHQLALRQRRSIAITNCTIYLYYLLLYFYRSRQKEENKKNRKKGGKKKKREN